MAIVCNLHWSCLDSTANQSTMLLHKSMRQLEVLVNFEVPTGQNVNTISWCDDIELFIDYDTEEPWVWVGVGVE